MFRLAFTRNFVKFPIISQINKRWASTIAINLTEAVNSSSNRVVNINKIPLVQTQYSGYCTETLNKKKPKKNPPAVEHVGRLDLRIGKIVDIQKAPDADTLYLTKVDIGGEILSIVAGLAKFIPSDELLNKSVVVLCNLKPSKLRGHLSEGMILCAKVGEQMEALQPPSNATPGDLVYCESYDRVPVETPRDKKKLFDPLAPDFHTNDKLVACYKGSYLYLPEKGNILTKSLKNANVL